MDNTVEMEFSGERFVPTKELMKDEIAIEHYHRYYSVLDVVRGKRVLDIASGEGYGSFLLAQTADEVYGVDIDETSIAHARQKYGEKEPRIKFIEGNAIQIPLDDKTVDVVVCFETIEHLDANLHERFFQEIKRVLSSDGVLVISTPDKANYSDRYEFSNEFHLKEFQKREFFDMLAGYFKRVDEYVQGFEIVSAITEDTLSELNNVKLLGWKRDEHQFSRKYLIAVCCNNAKKQYERINSVVFQGEKEYLRIMDRIVEMEAHILELGAWGRSLDKEIAEKNKLIETHQKMLQDQTELQERAEAATQVIEREEQLKEMLSRYENQITHLLDEKKNMIERERFLHSMVKSQADGVINKLTELSTHQKLITQLESRFFEKEKALFDVMGQLKSEEQAKVGLSTQLVQTKSDLEEVNRLRIQLNDALENAKTELDQNVNQQEVLKEMLTKTQATQVELSSTIHERDKTISELTDEFAALREAKLTAESEVRKRTAAFQDITIKLTKAEIQKSNVSAEVNKVKQELGAAKNDIADQNNIINELNQKLARLYNEQHHLNARLNEIYHSDGWKLLDKYYRIKGKVLPENSGRYRFLKKTLNLLRGRKNDVKSYGVPTVYEKPAQPVAVPAPQIVNTVAPTTPQVYPIIEFPIYNNPSVSIVLPAYNGWELTYKCLESIMENTAGVSYEIIIGDDASTDETRNIKEYIKNIQVVRHEKNLEFLFNCNKAATYAKGDYILFLNNDTEVRPNWLSSMVELMERDSTIGMTGSKLVYPNGQLQEAGGIIWKDASGWNFGNRQNPDVSEFNYVKETDYISGASIMIRTSLWEKIGGFDIRFAPAYCEDSDLAFEVRKHGYKVVYQPLSEVIHFEGYTHGSDTEGGIKGSEIKEYQKLNGIKFYEKWKSVLDKEHFPNAEELFWARDKSFGKKTILVIDHYVPQFDKDAGSRTVFQYLKLFSALNFNVKFIGDNFYRHEPYTTVLQQLGIEVLYGPAYANNWQKWIKDNGDKFDFVWLNRPHISIKYIDFIKANTKARILYYGHDLHFVRELKQYEVEKRKELLASAEKWKEIETTLFNKADIILTPSTDEKKLIEGLGVTNNAQAIKPYIFDTIPEPITDFHHRKDILFIGGFTHQPNIDAVLWFIREVWPLITRKVADVKFIIVGSNAPKEVTELAGDNVIVKGFVTDEQLDRLYSEVKLVVVPLRYGAGVKGKTVEAMHRGLPLVATTFGVEGLPGNPSFITAQDTEKGFADETCRLYNLSDEELMALSKKEISYIHDHFHFDVVKQEMLDVLGL